MLHGSAGFSSSRRPRSPGDTPTTPGQGFSTAPDQLSPQSAITAEHISPPRHRVFSETPRVARCASVIFACRVATTGYAALRSRRHAQHQPAVAF